jgi:hypothetical protein
MLGTANLTNNSAEQRATAPGQAHFAGSGPADKTCGDCRFRGYFRRTVTKKHGAKSTRTYRCAKFHALTGRHGPAISKYLRSCKYFEADEAK